MKFIEMKKITVEELNAENVELNRYGKITSDITLDTIQGECVRITTFNYNNKNFYRHMCNGEIIEIFEI